MTGRTMRGAGREAHDPEMWHADAGTRPLGTTEDRAPTPTSGDDVLEGTAAADTIDGLAGNDTIDGRGGADQLYGDEGNDRFVFSTVQIGGTPDLGLIDGGADDDTIDLRNVSPVTLGTIQTAPGTFAQGLYVGSQKFELRGIEHILFGAGADYVHTSPGFAGTQELRAGGGGDDIGVETLAEGAQVGVYGEDGDDTFFVSGSFGGAARGGVLDGGAGTDLLKLNIAFTVDLAAGTAVAGTTRFSVAGFEQVQAAATGGYQTIVRGSAAAETFGVNPLFNDGATGVVFEGRDGADSLNGSAGADVLVAGALASGSYAYSVETGLEVDVLRGGDGNDTLHAGYGDDVDGGAGSDVATLSLANAPAATYVVVSTTGPGVFVDDGYDIRNVEAISLIVGSGFDDRIVVAGNGGALTVLGGGGNDNVSATDTPVYFFGEAGADRFNSGAGADRFDGGAGRNTLSYQGSATGVTVRMGATQAATGTASDGDSFANVDTIFGSLQADTIEGSGQADELYGEAGDDVLRGFGGDDILIGGAGNDLLYGGTGDDSFDVDSAQDQVFEGIGEGLDTVRASVSFTLAAGQEIENLYAGGSILAGASAPAINLTGNGFAQTIAGNGAANVLTGGGGDDYILGFDGDDTLIAGAGTVRLDGGADNDVFVLGDTLTAADRIDGGGGTNDQVGILGNYTGANRLVLAATTLVDIDVLAALPGGSYDIVVADGTVAAGAAFTVFGGNLAAGETLTVDASAESDGRVVVYGGLGTDTLTGGAGADGFYFGPGRYGPGDTVRGGGGANDQLALDGNYTLTLTSREDVEVFVMLRGPAGDANTFNITVGDSFTPTGQTRTLYGLSVTTDLIVDGAGERDGSLRFFGGSGRDTLTGGAGNDWFFGNVGGDTLTGGGGADIFAYNGASESTGPGFDRLVGLTNGVDRIDLPGTISAVRATVTAGALSGESFNADLAAAVGAGQLGAGQAVLFTPTSGTLAGTVFLVADANGIPGYQADADFVFQLVAPPPVVTPDLFI